jgi:hypothetical protein
MKKLLIAIAVGGMLLTSASVAEAGNRQNDWVGPLIIGTVIGTILHGEVHEHRPRRHHHRHHRRVEPRRYIQKCMTVGADWTPYGYRPRIQCHYVPAGNHGYSYYEN